VQVLHDSVLSAVRDLPVAVCCRCVMHGLLPADEAEAWVRGNKGGRGAASTPVKAAAKRPGEVAAGCGACKGLLLLWWLLSTSAYLSHVVKSGCTRQDGTV